MSRSIGAVAILAALLLQILLPSLSAPHRATTGLLFDLAAADGFCFGAAPAGRASPSDDGAPAPDGRRHDCCVLCGTPGLAVAAPPVGHGPAWSRIVTPPAGRAAVVVVAAIERAPIHPRAPPIG